MRITKVIIVQCQMKNCKNNVTGYIFQVHPVKTVIYVCEDHLEEKGKTYKKEPKQKR